MQRLLRILEFTAVTLLVVLLSTNAGAQATFGRIQSQAGDPRIMQFGIKYGF